MAEERTSRLIENLQPGDWEEVTPNVESALADLETARNHLRSANKIFVSDPIGAYQLTYDAARKALQSALLACGVRITAKGGHYAFVRVAESSVFQSATFLKFREMRMLRNQAEYPSPENQALTGEIFQEAHKVTVEMVDEVSNFLAREKRAE